MKELILTIDVDNPSLEEKGLIDQHAEGRLHRITLFGAEYQIVGIVFECHSTKIFNRYNTLEITASRLRFAEFPGGL